MLNNKILRFLFPSDVIEPKNPDDAFTNQIEAFRNAGFETSIVSLEYLQEGKYKVFPPILEGEIIVYRGWMMARDEYAFLCNQVTTHGSEMLTDGEAYLRCHHLPNWYPLISEFTPKTLIFPADSNLKAELDALDWDCYFIKDYVKSLKIGSGSLIRSTDDVPELIANMIQFRGEIEGGFCVREVENFVPDSEIRYFVIRGIPYANDSNQGIPRIVDEVASRLDSPFFSIDIIKHKDGRNRVVEIGDGQVSDLVGWTPQRLVAIWKMTIRKLDKT